MTKAIQCFLIDDDPDDQEIFSLALEEIDQEISLVFSSNGPDALRRLEDHQFTPQYIFVDINMPRMNGRACLQELKKIDRLKEVPIYLYSTFADPNWKQETPGGATDYIIKPSTVSGLSGILKDILH